MTSQAIAARPYGRAAFEHSLSHQALLPWALFLEALSRIGNNAAFIQFLQHPIATPTMHYELINELVPQVTGQALLPTQQNFLHLLAQNHRLNLLSAIALEFKQLHAEHQKTVVVEITGFLPVSEDQQYRLRTVLSKKLHRNVSLLCKVDANLLGGAILRVKALDLVIDGSVRRQLQRLAEQLIT